MLCSSCLRARFGIPAIRPSAHPKNLPRLPPRRPLSGTARLSPSCIQPRGSGSRDSFLNAHAIPALAPRFGSRPYSSSPSESLATESTTTQPASGGLEKPDFLDDAESVIWDRLVAEFAPTELLVQDISGGCGSMYGIEISSERFRGANMLKQQRMVNSVLADLMKGWHGVQLKTRVP
ncbi:bola protein [Phialemonium atrogriseum]|uniref:Bola protein n=1 Tax=Phialemonium atrogriseum TaxID=1093897 RepID=A0AAJ0BUT0_9PEZI|nr:bola protein [Phialemonium atrogriseum]KAK1763489.1 bola protein [Phialemonium atrogriseum]